MSDEIRPFAIDVPESVLDDLRVRLAHTRWPDRETVDDWSQGIPLGYVQDVARYWADGYDWRAAESRINELPSFQTEIGGQRVHFLKFDAERADSVPIVLTNGWPSTFFELVGLAQRLARPSEHGSSASVCASTDCRERSRERCTSIASSSIIRACVSSSMISMRRCRFAS